MERLGFFHVTLELCENSRWLRKCICEVWGSRQCTCSSQQTGELWEGTPNLVFNIRMTLVPPCISGHKNKLILEDLCKFHDWTNLSWSDCIPHERNHTKEKNVWNKDHGGASNRLANYSQLSWRRQWQPTPVLLPGKSHGQRSLEGYSPWGREELDTTEWLLSHFSLSCIGEGNGNPFLCSCLENPRDGGAWWPAVYGVAQSRTRLNRLSSSSSSKGIEIIESVLLSLWTYVRNQYQKIFENNTHIFKCNVTFTKIFDLTIESLNKVRRLKKPRGRLQRRKHLNEKLISK